MIADGHAALYISLVILYTYVSIQPGGHREMANVITIENGNLVVNLRTEPGKQLAADVLKGLRMWCSPTPDTDQQLKNAIDLLRNGEIPASLELEE